jgi:hypothetical protein
MDQLQQDDLDRWLGEQNTHAVISSVTS